MLVYKISWETLSVTSRRHFLKYSVTPRREIPRRDVIFEVLCHVATSDSTSRRHLHISLPRRDVDLHVVTSIGTALCHVATWPRTSRRRLVMCSVTSRRAPERRDVGFFALCDVATSPRTSRRDPVFSLRIVHFGHSPPTPITRNPSLLAFLHSLALPELSVTPTGGL